MEGSGFGGFPFGGDPEDLLRGLREFAEQQAESVQGAQREQFATLTLNTAVELTAAALKQVQPTGAIDEQTIALRDAMRVLFPEAVALVWQPARASCKSVRLRRHEGARPRRRRRAPGRPEAGRREALVPLHRRAPTSTPRWG